MFQLNCCYKQKEKNHKTNSKKERKVGEKDSMDKLRNVI